jgi:hypothetical protein
MSYAEHAARLKRHAPLVRHFAAVGLNRPGALELQAKIRARIILIRTFLELPGSLACLPGLMAATRCGFPTKVSL